MKFNRFIITAGLALTAAFSMIAGAATAAPEVTPSTIAGSGQIAAKAGDSTSFLVWYYDIYIHTANVNYAGTDGNVYLRVNGTYRRSTPLWFLDDRYDNYERNRIDHFNRKDGYVGPLTSVTICLYPLGGDNAEWLPDWVRVNNVTFYNTEWFTKTHNSCKILSRR